jgi:hypothetical protein
MMKKTGVAIVLLAALAAGCRPPTVTHYRSAFHDYVADLPSGWNVYTDAQGADFAETRFIGPFDPDAFFGLPSFSVKWFRNSRPHTLRTGQTETYANADDYIQQMLTQVYDYRYTEDNLAVLLSVVPDAHNEFTTPIPQIADLLNLKLTHQESGLPLKMFIIHSPRSVSSGIRWGVDVGPDGHTYNNRMHAYALISMRDGFYVLSYPATVHSFTHDYQRFSRLVATFHPLTDGPGGPKVLLTRSN